MDMSLFENQLIKNELWVLGVCFFSISFAAGLMPVSFDRMEARFKFRKWGIANYFHVLILATILAIGNYYFKDTLKYADPVLIKKARTLYSGAFSLIYIIFFLYGAMFRRIQIKNDYIRKVENELYESSKLNAFTDLSVHFAHNFFEPAKEIIKNTKANLETVRAGKIDANALSFSMNQTIQHMEHLESVLGLVRRLSTSEDNENLEEAVNVEKAVNKALDICHDRLEATHIKAKLNMTSGLMARTNSSQLSQVVLSLLNNSLDSIQTKATPWIEIESKKENGKIILRITDSGHGIPKLIREKIMLPFFSTKGFGKGKGLSLYHSKNLLEKYKGSLYLDESSKNTSFVIVLNEYAQEEGVLAA